MIGNDGVVRDLVRIEYKWIRLVLIRASTVSVGILLPFANDSYSVLHIHTATWMTSR